MHILFCRHIWAELSLFWTFLSGTFFAGGGGGGGGGGRGGCGGGDASAPPSVRACVLDLEFRPGVTFLAFVFSLISYKRIKLLFL